MACCDCCVGVSPIRPPINLTEQSDSIKVRISIKTQYLKRLMNDYLKVDGRYRSYSCNYAFMRFLLNEDSIKFIIANYQDAKNGFCFYEN